VHFVQVSRVSMGRNVLSRYEPDTFTSYQAIGLNNCPLSKESEVANSVASHLQSTMCVHRIELN